MKTRNVKKNLIGEQDVAYGEGQVDQTRAGGDYAIDQIRSLWPINDVAELDTLDPTRHPKAVRLDRVTLKATMYQWVSGTNSWTAIPLGDSVQPNDSINSVVYRRQETKPAVPTGGSYDNLVPINWSSSIPAGTGIVWSSSRIFFRNGGYPQASIWSAVAQLSDSAPVIEGGSNSNVSDTDTYTWLQAEESDQVVKTWSITADAAIREIAVGSTDIVGIGTFTAQLRRSTEQTDPLTWPVVESVSRTTEGIFLPMYDTVPNGQTYYYALSIRKGGTEGIAQYLAQPLRVDIFIKSPIIVF